VTILVLSERALHQFERRYRRVAFESRLSIMRVAFVVMIVSFAAGITMSALGSKFPWADITLLAFVVGGSQFAIVWTLSFALSLARKNWSGAALLGFLSAVVWYFMFMAARAYPLSPK